MRLILCYYFLYFIIYSFIGWILEVIYALFTRRKFINRGFLIGPYCPIYGFGLLLILFFIKDIQVNFIAKFFIIGFVCSVFEYFISYIMEKLFKARWWDYSNDMFNINGRVCLETFLEFSLVGSLAIHFVHPFVSGTLYLLNANSIYILTIISFVLFFIDVLVSYRVLNKVKNKIGSEQKDNTEEINQIIDEWLMKNNTLYKRLKKAFPKFSVTMKNVNKVISNLK